MSDDAPGDAQGLDAGPEPDDDSDETNWLILGVAEGSQDGSGERHNEDLAGHVRRGLEADARGRLVEPTIESYSKLSRDSGKKGVAEALIARANLRWENASTSFGFAAGVGLPWLSRLYAIDRTLLSLGLAYGPESDLHPKR